MVVKSHGPRKRTREKFRRTGRTPISSFLKTFNIGDKVVVDIDSSSQSGVPFRRFQGLVGEVVESRGKSYVIKIKDGGKTKIIISKSEHLKKV